MTAIFHFILATNNIQRSISKIWVFHSLIKYKRHLPRTSIILVKQLWPRDRVFR